MFKRIIEELKHHAPFTAIGASSGIILMFLFRNLPESTSRELFYVFHPLHVLLSALATATMYKLHNCPRGKGKPCNLPLLFLVGYVGSIGVATLSDSVMPYIGELLLKMPHAQAHIGFIEKWWLISAVAIVGIIIAYFNPSTKFPHAAHVLISTWASLFHILMAMGKGASWLVYTGVFLFLFLAVWVPCCFSDIVFPLLFVKTKK
ncbi:MAG: hypothetical protein KJ619_00470 [Candidatus Omnitrophica bacterium]|nr:hypothetical protein [Candidatus Omnitrophota bacterium]MBU2250781.1 hypothetical protein [Candidatus Omnitrophota bacterium]